MLSVVILTKNEEHNIAKVIESAQFADEIVVVDDMSTDTTRDLAQRAGAVVYKRESNGNFASQRNYAMTKTRQEWVLFLDADERISKELQEEVQVVLGSQSKYEAFSIPRQDFFKGKKMKHGEVQSIREFGLIRLMKKDSGTWEGAVHERFKTNEAVGQLKSFIYHYPHQSIAEFLENINWYSTLRAKELFDKKVKVGWLSIITYPTVKFMYTYFLRRGFKDGPHGFIYSFMMSFHSFLVRGKLYLLNAKK